MHCSFLLTSTSNQPQAPHPGGYILPLTFLFFRQNLRSSVRFSQWKASRNCTYSCVAVPCLPSFLVLFLLIVWSFSLPRYRHVLLLLSTPKAFTSSFPPRIATMVTTTNSPKSPRAPRARKLPRPQLRPRPRSAPKPKTPRVFFLPRTG